MALRTDGYRVRAARDAYEAQRVFASSHPDIVLSDIRMPGDGMTLLRCVHDMSPQTPVILMTGFEQPDDRRRALAGGAKDLLVKPLVGERLRNALRRVLDRGGPTARQTRPSSARTSRMSSTVPSAPLGP